MSRNSFSISYASSLLLIAMCSLSNSSFSDEHLSPSNNNLSCSDVMEIVKQSDCAELVRPLLDGASVSAGLALRSLNITIKDSKSDSTLAEVTDTALPAPFISFNLRPSFFADTHWGWGVGFNYTDAYALEQRLRRSGDNKNADLGSFMTTTMLAVTPNMFYQIGDLYSEHYFRLGLGMALGYASVKGNAYLTEDKSNTACYDAGTDFVNGTGPASTKLRITAIKQNCEQEDYHHGSLGVGANLFMEGQYDRWRASLSLSNLLLNKNRNKLEPSIISFELSYVIPL